MRLLPRRYLDPREPEQAAARPVVDAVNIPFAELPERVHELPPRERELGVVGPAPLVREVIAWLGTIGRRGVAVESSSKAGNAADPSVLGRLWEPTAFLRDVLGGLWPAGVALELACGFGRDAVFLSSCGWRVTAADVSPEALSHGHELEARYAAALRPIRWLEVDLEGSAPHFDPAFDLIMAFRYLHRPLFPHLRDWLRPGGSVVWETFTRVHRERYGRPSRDAHVLESGELPELLAGFEIRHQSEGWRGWAHTARVWAVLGESAT